MKISNIQDCLNHTSTDPGAGVKLALLTGEEKLSIFAIELAKGQSIPAHYHQHDIETYFILEGQGRIDTGSFRDEKIQWDTAMQVKAGDSFTIYPGQVHAFRNLSAESLRILGAAPLSHSRDDRYFVEERESQLP